MVWPWSIPNTPLENGLAIAIAIALALAHGSASSTTVQRRRDQQQRRLPMRDPIVGQQFPMRAAIPAEQCTQRGSGVDHG